MKQFYLAWALVALIGVIPVDAWARDLHAGYYYPQPDTREVYVSKVPLAPDASVLSRAAFAIGLDKRQRNLSYAPTYHLFAKGAQLEKLIIVGIQGGRYDTLYRMRALLASLTSLARATPIFTEAREPHRLNFLDFCKLMGFTQLTLSDGASFAHQITVE
jgi:hypothetical protein